MTINQAYNFINYCANKSQRGNITPENFNTLAAPAQLEFINTRLGNIKRVAGGRVVPDVGFNANQIVKEDLRELIKDTSSLTVNSTTGRATYPSDYLFFDNMELTDGTPITVVDTDQIGRIRKSRIHPPTAEFPFAVLDKSYIQVYPVNVTGVVWSYLFIPPEPNWDYQILNNKPVYNAGLVPQATGKVSQGFSVPVNRHKEICMIMLREIGINLDMDTLTKYANAMLENGL